MANSDDELIPVRMLNEFVYCPRLAILEWVDGEFLHSGDTVQGALRHRSVDQPGRRIRRRKRPDSEAEAEQKGEAAGKKEKPEPKGAAADGTSWSPPATRGVEQIRAVELSDPDLGLIAKLDWVEIEGRKALPVDVKKGKRPHIAKNAYDPERVQVCAQGLLLRAHGWECDAGALYFAGSAERVEVPFDDELIEMTQAAIVALRAAAGEDSLPPPLEDSPKCVRCSLAPICLPDETRRLVDGDVEVRPLVPAETNRFPMHVQTAGGVVRKKGELLEVWAEEGKVGEMRLREISQVALLGRSHITEPALRELMKREIPVVHLSQGGWLYGVSEGLPHKNIQLRRQQFRLADDPEATLRIARAIVRAKILNQRVLLRRNGGDALRKAVLDELRREARNAGRAPDLESLLGHEGRAARTYFASFHLMLRPPEGREARFDFDLRSRRPPRDPVNAMLSFGYAMLAREWLQVCRSVGFDPYLGYLHRPRYGRPALALDLMEPFRSLIADSVVVRLVNNGEIKPSGFIERMGAVALTPSGRRSFLQAFEQRLAQEVTHPVFGYRCDYRRIFEIEGRLLGRHVSGELPTYEPLVTR